MIRLALYLLWGVVLALLVLPVLRKLAARRPPRLGIPDELVKDPVCQTYVVRSRAVSRPGGEAPVYFCSAECARRYFE